MKTWVLVIIAIIIIIYFVYLDNESSTKPAPPEAGLKENFNTEDNQEYEPDIMFPEFKSRLDKNTIDKNYLKKEISWQLDNKSKDQLEQIKNYISTKTSA